MPEGTLPYVKRPLAAPFVLPTMPALIMVMLIFAIIMIVSIPVVVKSVILVVAVAVAWGTITSAVSIVARVFKITWHRIFSFFYLEYAGYIGSCE